MNLSDNLAGFIAQKIEKLPAQIKEVLKIAAAIGNEFSLRAAAQLNNKSEEETAKELFIALQENMIIQLSKDADILYRFSHDQVQQAAYSLIPVEEIGKLHLKIAYFLQASLSPDKQDELIFEIANHFLAAIKLIISSKQRESLCRLFFMAGKKAKESIAYEAALKYLTIAGDFLGKESWNENYQLTIDIYKELAVAEYLNGNLERSEDLINTILWNARTDIEKGEIYRLLIVQYTLQAKYSRAIEALKKALAPFNIFLPDSDLQSTLDKELILAKLNLGDKEVSSIYNAPEMKNSESIIAVKLLTTALPTAYISNPLLWCIITLKTVNLCLINGNLGEIYGYACYGILLGSMGEYKLGCDFCKLALALSEKFNDMGEKCKASNVLANHSLSYVHHIRDAYRINMEGFQAGLDSGEFLHASYITLHMTLNTFYSGQNLNQLLKEIKQIISFSKRAKNHLTIDMNSGVEIIANNLTGKKENADEFNNGEMNENEFLNICIEHGNMNVTCIYHIMRAEVYFLYYKFTDALLDLIEACNLMHFIPGEEAITEHNFYYSLTLASLYNNALEDEKMKHLEQIKANQKQMKIWAESCKENFLHKYLLVEAEIAGIEDRDSEAIDLYDKAIESAKENEFIQNEAIANELAAKYWLHKKGKKEFAKLYLNKAYYKYKLWGANAKLKQMEEHHYELLKSSNIIDKQKDSSSASSYPDNIDIETIVKACQALSGEIVLSELLKKMMRIMIENAGAQKGMFVSVNDGKFFVDATEDSDISKVALSRSIPLDSVDVDQQPVTFFKHVAQTKEYIMLDNLFSRKIVTM